MNNSAAPPLPLSPLLPPRRLSCAHKTIIITGGNCGIGYETAKQLAELGAHIIIACRSPHKAADAIQRMGEVKGKIEWLPLSLDNLDTVKSFARTFLQRFARLDGIVCSAGINSSSDPENDVFAVNCTAHFYLVSLLTPLLKKSGTLNSPSRVVTLSSAMHVSIAKSASHLVAWEEATTANAYSRSKLGLHLMANYITKHGAPLVLGVAVNPGAVNSSIWRGSSSWIQCVASLLFLSSKQGAQPCVYAMASPSILCDAVLSHPKHSFFYVTPYTPICAPCVRCCPANRLFRRGWLLLSNLTEAVFGRCLFARACYGTPSAVACDEREMEHFFKFAIRSIEAWIRWH